MEGPIVELVTKLGFPVFVALWFMIRMERRMDKLTRRVHQLIRVQTLTLTEQEKKLLEAIPKDTPGDDL